MDEIPLDHLTAPAVMVDIREKAAQYKNSNVTLQDIEQWESDYGRIPDRSVVFMCSGWSDYYGVDKAAYWGNDQENTSDFHFPGFGNDAVTWLIENRDIVGVASDTASVEPGNILVIARFFPVHVTIGEHNVYGMENVKDSCELPVSGATVYVSPMKIVHGSGAPARVMAVWDDVNDEASGSRSTNEPFKMAAAILFCWIVSR